MTFDKDRSLTAYSKESSGLGTCTSRQLNHAGFKLDNSLELSSYIDIRYAVRR